MLVCECKIVRSNADNEQIEKKNSTLSRKRVILEDNKTASYRTNRSVSLFGNQHDLREKSLETRQRRRTCFNNEETSPRTWLRFLYCQQILIVGTNTIKFSSARYACDHLTYIVNNLMFHYITNQLKNS